MGAVYSQLSLEERRRIERVPLDRWVDGPVPVRQEGDTMIVTLFEEVGRGSVAGAEMLARCRLPKLRVVAAV